MQQDDEEEVLMGEPPSGFTSVLTPQMVTVDS